MKFQLHRPLSPSGWVHACEFFRGSVLMTKKKDLCEAPCGDTNIAVFRVSPREPIGNTDRLIHFVDPFSSQSDLVFRIRNVLPAGKKTMKNIKALKKQFC